MKKKFHPYLKWVSGLLLLTFFFQDVSYAALDLKPAQFNLFQKPLVNFEIPRYIAIVNDAWRASSSSSPESLVGDQPIPAKSLAGMTANKTIFLIQDAHTNESGQRNAAKALETILSHQKIKYVFLEAGTGDDSLSFIRARASLEKRKEAAEEYLGKGVLSGGEFLDLTSDREFILWGVEDKSLYWKALEAYKAVAQDREKFEDFLKRIESTVETLKSRLFNPALKAFDEKHEAFLKEKIALTDYFEILSDEAAKKYIALDYFPHLSTLKGLKERERTIDFRAANEEQLRAIQAASPEDAAALLQASQESRTPFKYSSADHKVAVAFYRLLEEIVAKQSKLPLAPSLNKEGGSTQYPNLARYFAYIKEADKLDPKKILAEQKLLENQIYESLTRNDDERDLRKASENLRSLKGLMELTLTPEEFEAYKGDPKGFDTVFMTGFLNRKIMDLKNFYERAVFLENGYEEYIKHAEAFYELTIDRDKVFVENLSQKMDAEHETQAVLVAGGYHTPNLKALFKQNNISYVVVTPQIYHETNHKRYEKLLLSQKSEVSRQKTVGRIQEKQKAEEDDKMALLPFFEDEAYFRPALQAMTGSTTIADAQIQFYKDQKEYKPFSGRLGSVANEEGRANTVNGERLTVGASKKRSAITENRTPKTKNQEPITVVSGARLATPTLTVNGQSVQVQNDWKREMPIDSLLQGLGIDHGSVKSFVMQMTKDLRMPVQRSSYEADTNHRMSFGRSTVDLSHNSVEIVTSGARLADKEENLSLKSRFALFGYGIWAPIEDRLHVFKGLRRLQVRRVLNMYVNSMTQHRGWASMVFDAEADNRLAEFIRVVVPKVMDIVLELWWNHKIEPVESMQFFLILLGYEQWPLTGIDKDVTSLQTFLSDMKENGVTIDSRHLLAIYYATHPKFAGQAPTFGQNPLALGQVLADSDLGTGEGVGKFVRWLIERTPGTMAHERVQFTEAIQAQRFEAAKYTAFDAIVNISYAVTASDVKGWVSALMDAGQVENAYEVAFTAALFRIMYGLGSRDLAIEDGRDWFARFLSIGDYEKAIHIAELFAKGVEPGSRVQDDPSVPRLATRLWEILLDHPALIDSLQDRSIQRDANTVMKALWAMRDQGDAVFLERPKQPKDAFTAELDHLYRYGDIGLATRDAWVMAVHDYKVSSDTGLQFVARLQAFKGQIAADSPIQAVITAIQDGLAMGAITVDAAKQYLWEAFQRAHPESDYLNETALSAVQELTGLSMASPRFFDDWNELLRLAAEHEAPALASLLGQIAREWTETPLDFEKSSLNNAARRIQDVYLDNNLTSNAFRTHADVKALMQKINVFSGARLATSPVDRASQYLYRMSPLLNGQEGGTLYLDIVSRSADGGEIELTQGRTTAAYELPEDIGKLAKATRVSEQELREAITGAGARLAETDRRSYEDRIFTGLNVGIGVFAMFPAAFYILFHDAPMLESAITALVSVFIYNYFIRTKADERGSFRAVHEAFQISTTTPLEAVRITTASVRSLLYHLEHPTPGDGARLAVNQADELAGKPFSLNKDYLLRLSRASGLNMDALKEEVKKIMIVAGVGGERRVSILYNLWDDQDTIWYLTNRFHVTRERVAQLQKSTLREVNDILRRGRTKNGEAVHSPLVRFVGVEEAMAPIVPTSSVSRLGRFGTRIDRAFRSLNILKVEDLTSKSADDFKTFIGKRSVSRIVKILSNNGLSLRSGARLAAKANQEWLTPAEATKQLDKLPTIGTVERLQAYSDEARKRKLSADAFLNGLKPELEQMEYILRRTRPVDELSALSDKEGVQVKQLDILRASSEIILQLLPQKQGVNNLERLKEIRSVFARHPEISRTLIEYFETRFDLKKEADDRGEDAGQIRHKRLQGMLEELKRKRPEDYDVLHAALGIMIATVKTDYFAEGRTELMLKLSPRALVVHDLAGTLTFTAPYGLIWVHVPYGAFGVHTRYSDVARGGLRSIRPERINLLNRVISESLALSFTQHRKHTDIAEGGSKGVYVYQQGLNRVAASIGYVDGLISSAMASKQIAESSDSGGIDPLELGPDEGTSGLSNLVTARAWMRKLPSWRLLMTGKSSSLGGVSHMKNNLLSPPEAGNRVTSQGVMTHVFEMVRYLRDTKKIKSSDGEPIIFSMTGGLDGDVGSGNVQQAIAHYGPLVKIRSIVDHSGVVSDPEGLDHEVLLEMYASGSPVRTYPLNKLHAGGFVAEVKSEKSKEASEGQGNGIDQNYITLNGESLQAMNISALDPVVLRELGLEPFYKEKAGVGASEPLITVLERDAANRPSKVKVHKAYLRDTIFFITKADLLITGGGTKDSIDGSNWPLFFDQDGNPTTAGIVHGANVFTAKTGSINLEKKGVVIEPDEKANSVGVEISSRMEVDFNAIFGMDEISLVLMVDYFEQVLKKSLDNAQWKFWALRMDAEDRPGESVVTKVSPAMSSEIMGLAELIRTSGLVGNKMADYQPELLDRLRAYFPDVTTFDQKYASQTTLDRVFDRMPVARLQASASKMVAKEAVLNLGMGTIVQLSNTYGAKRIDVIKFYLEEAKKHDTYSQVNQVLENKEGLSPKEQIAGLRAIREELKKSIVERLQPLKLSGARLAATAPQTRSFVSILRAEYIGLFKYMSFHAALFSAAQFVAILHLKSVPQYLTLLLVELAAAFISGYPALRTQVAIHEAGHYIEAKKQGQLIGQPDSEGKEIKVPWKEQIGIFTSIFFGKFGKDKDGYIGVEVDKKGNTFIPVKKPILAIRAAGPKASLTVGKWAGALAAPVFAGALLTAFSYSMIVAAPIAIASFYLFSVFIVGIISYGETDEEAYREAKILLQATSAQEDVRMKTADEIAEQDHRRSEMRDTILSGALLKKIHSAQGFTATLPAHDRNLQQGGVHAVLKRQVKGPDGKTHKMIFPRGNLTNQEIKIMPNPQIDSERINAMVRDIQVAIETALLSADASAGLQYVGIGNEGGVLGIYRGYEKQALQILRKAVKDAGYKMGKDVFVSLDMAASEMANAYKQNVRDQNGMYQFYMRGSKDVMDSEALAKYTVELLDEFPEIVMLEDGMSEDDIEGWKLLREKTYKKGLILVADDVSTTNEDRINELAQIEIPVQIDGKSERVRLFDILLFKINQIGTLTEAMLADLAAQKWEIKIETSHRSGKALDHIEGVVALGSPNNIAIKNGGGQLSDRHLPYGYLIIQERKANSHIPRGKIIGDPTIIDFHAREILTGDGRPTNELRLSLSDSREFVAQVPVGASAGAGEAVHRVDGEMSRYDGQGTRKVADYINREIAPLFVNKKLSDLRKMGLTRLVEVDRLMLSYEKKLSESAGTITAGADRHELKRIMQTKAEIGANATLPVSEVFLYLFAAMEGLEDWEYYHKERASLGSPGSESQPESAELTQNRDYLYGFAGAPKFAPVSQGARLALMKKVFKDLSDTLPANGIRVTINSWTKAKMEFTATTAKGQIKFLYTAHDDAISIRRDDEQVKRELFTSTGEESAETPLLRVKRGAGQVVLSKPYKTDSLKDFVSKDNTIYMVAEPETRINNDDLPLPILSPSQVDASYTVLAGDFGVRHKEGGLLAPEGTGARLAEIISARFYPNGVRPMEMTLTISKNRVVLNEYDWAMEVTGMPDASRVMFEISVGDLKRIRRVTFWLDKTSRKVTRVIGPNLTGEYASLNDPLTDFLTAVFGGKTLDSSNPFLVSKKPVLARGRIAAISQGIEEYGASYYGADYVRDLAGPLHNITIRLPDGRDLDFIAYALAKAKGELKGYGIDETASYKLIETSSYHLVIVSSAGILADDVSAGATTAFAKKLGGLLAPEGAGARLAAPHEDILEAISAVTRLEMAMPGNGEQGTPKYLVIAAGTAVRQGRYQAALGMLEALPDLSGLPKLSNEDLSTLKVISIQRVQQALELEHIYSGSVMYAIMPKDAWTYYQAKGEITPSGTKSYISFSTNKQVLFVANKYLSKAKDLVVLRVETDKVQKDRIGTDFETNQYPHYYGNVPVKSVSGVIELFRESTEAPWAARAADVASENFEVTGARLTILGQDIVSTDKVDVTKLSIPGVQSVYGLELPEKMKKIVALNPVVLLVRSETDVTKELIEQLPRLRYIIRMGHGTNNIKVSPEYLASKGIELIPTKGSKGPVSAWVLRAAGAVIQGPQTAEVDKISAEFLPLESFRLAQDEKLKGDKGAAKAKGDQILKPLNQTTESMMKGKVIGIYGAGDIGLELAERAKALGMTVLLNSASSNAEEGLSTEMQVRRNEFKALGFQYASAEQINSTANFTAILTGSTPSTQNLIGPTAFQQMSKNAGFLGLINPDRKEVVDEEAALSFFSANPGAKYYTDFKPANSALRELPNVAYTLHIGATTPEARKEVIANTNEVLNRISAGARLAAEPIGTFQPSTSAYTLIYNGRLDDKNVSDYPVYLTNNDQLRQLAEQKMMPRVLKMSSRITFLTIPGRSFEMQDLGGIAAFLSEQLVLKAQGEQASTVPVIAPGAAAQKMAIRMPTIPAPARPDEIYFNPSSSSGTIRLITKAENGEIQADWFKANGESGPETHTFEEFKAQGYKNITAESLQQLEILRAAIQHSTEYAVRYGGETIWIWNPSNPANSPAGQIALPDLSSMPPDLTAAIRGAAVLYNHTLASAQTVPTTGARLATSVNVLSAETLEKLNKQFETFFAAQKDAMRLTDSNSNEYRIKVRLEVVSDAISGRGFRVLRPEVRSVVASRDIRHVGLPPMTAELKNTEIMTTIQVSTVSPVSKANLWREIQSALSKPDVSIQVLPEVSRKTMVEYPGSVQQAWGRIQTQFNKISSSVSGERSTVMPNLSEQNLPGRQAGENRLSITESAGARLAIPWQPRGTGLGGKIPVQAQATNALVKKDVAIFPTEGGDLGVFNDFQVVADTLRNYLQDAKLGYDVILVANDETRVAQGDFLLLRPSGWKVAFTRTGWLKDQVAKIESLVQAAQVTTFRLEAVRYQSKKSAGHGVLVVLNGASKESAPAAPAATLARSRERRLIQLPPARTGDVYFNPSSSSGTIRLITKAENGEIQADWFKANGESGSEPYTFEEFRAQGYKNITAESLQQLELLRAAIQHGTEYAVRYGSETIWIWNPSNPANSPAGQIALPDLSSMPPDLTAAIRGAAVLYNHALASAPTIQETGARLAEFVPIKNIQLEDLKAGGDLKGVFARDTKGASYYRIEKITPLDETGHRNLSLVAMGRKGNAIGSEFPSSTAILHFQNGFYKAPARGARVANSSSPNVANLSSPKSLVGDRTIPAKSVAGMTNEGARLSKAQVPSAVETVDAQLALRALKAQREAERMLLLTKGEKPIRSSIASSAQATEDVIASQLSPSLRDTAKQSNLPIRIVSPRLLAADHVRNGSVVGARLSDLLPSVETFLAGIAQARQVDGARLALNLEKNRALIFTLSRPRNGNIVVAHSNELNLELNVREKAAELRSSARTAPNVLLNVANLRQLENETYNHVINSLGAPTNTEKILVLDVHLDLLPKNSEEAFLGHLMDVLISEHRKEYGKNVYYRLIGGNDALREQALARNDAQGLFITDDKLPKDALRAQIVTQRGFSKDARNVLVNPLSEGDLPAFRAMIALAIFTGRIDLENIPQGYADAWATLAQNRPDNILLKEIIEGTVDLATAVKYALRPITRVDINTAVQFFKNMAKMIGKSA